jgi:hypothetical protein
MKRSMSRPALGIAAALLGTGVLWFVLDRSAEPLPTAPAPGHAAPPQPPPRPPQPVLAPGPAVSDHELGPLPQAPPAYLPQETPFQRTFARIRAQYLADPRTVIGRGGAARTLRASAEESAPLLKEAALKDPEDRFRAWALVLLGDLRRDELAEELFVPLLKEDPFAGVRAAAAQALGKLGPMRYADALRQAAESDADESVRAVAREALRLVPEGKTP